METARARNLTKQWNSSTGTSREAPRDTTAVNWSVTICYFHCYNLQAGTQINNSQVRKPEEIQVLGLLCWLVSWGGIPRCVDTAVPTNTEQIRLHQYHRLLQWSNCAPICFFLSDNLRRILLIGLMQRTWMLVQHVKNEWRKQMNMKF